MFKPTEKTFLQISVALACCVPISAGIYGILTGTHPDISDSDLDSHMRYLSGLLLAIGIGFLSCIPYIEKNTKRFQLLTFIVIIGGVGRLIGFFLSGIPGTVMVGALVRN